jgi:hypothetical protein
MMPGFWRYRARTHKKQASIMNIERILLLLVLLPCDWVEFPISFARRHPI